MSVSPDHKPQTKYLVQYRAERVWKDHAPRWTWDRRRSTKFMLVVVLVELYGASSTIRKFGNTCRNPVVEVKSESAISYRFISGKFGAYMNEAKSISNDTYV